MSNKRVGKTTKRAGKRALVPKLRFPEFWDAGEWEERRLREALTEKPRPINMNEDDEYSLVTVRRRYGGVVSRCVLKGASIKVKTQFLLQENDFLISKRQIVHCACGIVPKALDGTIVSNEYSVLRTRDGFDITFFDYFAQQPIIGQSFLRCSIGIVIEKMLFKLNDWLKQEFLFPSLPEQQRIADCLSSIDELITAQAERLAVLKTHKKGLMQQLFPAKGETLPKLRFPEFRDAGEWEEKTLEPLTTKVGSGITPTGGDKNYITAGRPFVRSQNVGWGELNLNDVVFIDEETHQSFNSTEIKLSDVLLNITGASIGRSVVADSRIAGGNVNQHVCIIRVKQGDLNPALLNHFLLSERGQKQIDSFQAGGNRQGLNFVQIRSFAVPLPPTEPEQQKIADCLSSIDELITAQTQKLAVLKTHKKGLMQQLFPVMAEVHV